MRVRDVYWACLALVVSVAIGLLFVATVGGPKPNLMPNSPAGTPVGAGIPFDYYENSFPTPTRNQKIARGCDAITRCDGFVTIEWEDGRWCDFEVDNAGYVIAKIECSEEDR